jgi:hypothetical protein
LGDVVTATTRGTSDHGDRVTNGERYRNHRTPPPHVSYVADPHQQDHSNEGANLALVSRRSLLNQRQSCGPTTPQPAAETD